MANDYEFFVCNYGCAAVALWQYQHNEKVGLMGLALWRYGAGSGFGWRWKLRHIWYIVRYGHPYVDDILLIPQDARRLGERLIELVGESNGD
jgi:hypothetical protein